jgi:hypothetical protein
MGKIRQYWQAIVLQQPEEKRESGKTVFCPQYDADLIQASGRMQTHYKPALTLHIFTMSR